MNKFDDFFKALQSSIERKDFVKITLSKPFSKGSELVNIYVRMIVLKEQPHLSFTYRYKTNDQVKNYLLTDVEAVLEELFLNSFRNGILFTLKENTQIFINKKRKVTTKNSAPTMTEKPEDSHDESKEKRVEVAKYLQHLGIMDSDGRVIHKMADKYRQINKYLEIIEDLISSTNLPKTVHIVDMGSGKGYLTFALYDYLKNTKKLDVVVTGIELRPKLVEYCNNVAKKCNFEGLNFQCISIQEYDEKRIDILIALHACDTATDDAIFKGLSAKAEVIVTAPCCHKQIRQQLKGQEQASPILKYGIFKERQYEMVTDTIRALILEKENYKTKIFEFVSNEHTRKNVMLVGTKSSKKVDTDLIESKIEELKLSFGISEHYLEGLGK